MANTNYNNPKVLIVRKKIKNLYLKINPRTLEIQVSSPIELDDRHIENFIERHSLWIHNQIIEISKKRKYPSFNQDPYINFFIFGKNYPIIYCNLRSGTKIISIHNNQIVINLRKEDKKEDIILMFKNFCRNILKEKAKLYISKWSHIMAVEPSSIKIRLMKTRWGSCNTSSRNITINLELIKFPDHILEYVIIHELNHLKYRGHGKDFKKSMDSFYPNWYKIDQELNKYIITL